MKKSSFKVEIYGVNVQVVLVPDSFKTTEFYISLIKKLNLPSEGDEPCEGFVLLHKNKSWIVLSEKHLSYNLISHEIFHCAYRILKYNEIEINESEEVGALLIGYLTEKVFKIIEKHNCKII